MRSAHWSPIPVHAMEPNQQVGRHLLKPGGLVDLSRATRGSSLPEATKKLGAGQSIPVEGKISTSW